jgi:hypothetical protein
VHKRQKKIRRHTLALAAAAALGAAAPGAQAATCTWNTTNGNWNALANWLNCVAGNGNPGGTPGGADTANIGSTGVVTVNTTQSVLNLNNAGTINIDAFLLSLVGGGSTVNTGTINVGGASTAALQVGAGHNIDNTGGTINVGIGSVVNQFGSTITGGTINTTGTGALVAFSNGNNFLNNVTLGGTMDMASNANSRQRITNGLTLANGLVNLNANGILSFEGTSTLGGTGSIVFGNAGSGNRIDLDGNGTTTIASGVTVRGHSGTIGQQINIGGTQTLANNGTISADVAGGTITITDSAITNAGTLSALNGGTLVLASNVTGVGSGQIVAGAGSQVLQNGVTLSGAINTSGSGLFSMVSNANNRLTGVTFNGNMDMAGIAGSRQRVSTGGLVLNGTVNLDQNGILSFEDDNSLTGNATIVLGATGGGNRIDLDGNGTTTFGANVLVRGTNGTIGQQINIGGTQVLVNNGTISADVSGGTITITQSDITNAGTLSALNGGTLVLASNVAGTGSGQIVADAGSQVLQSGVRISGTVNTSGSGLFSAISSASNFLDGVTLNGNLDMASLANSRERVVNGLTLNGVVSLNTNGILSFEGTSTLGGTGSIVFGNTGSGNRIDLDGNGTTTIASGVTVRGHSGTIGQQINIGGTQTLANNGTISADVAGGTITITDSAITNAGTLSALNGGTLVLSSNVTGAGSGQIVAGAGSTVRQNGVELAGTINISGGGLFSVVSSSNNRLTGVTFNGNMDMASIANSRQRVSAGGMTLNGTIDINNNGILSFEGDGTFAGTGTVVFGTTGSGNRLDLDGNGTTVFGSNILVRGHSGTIGQQINIGGTQTLVNNGRVSADVAGGTITIADSAVTNNSVLEARNGGTLRLTSAVTQSGSGVLLADNGVVQQGGVRITGGAIDSANGGVLRVESNGNNFIDAVAINGTMDMATIANSRQRVNNGATLNGTINLNSNAILSFEGTSTLGGSGSIVFGNTGTGNRIDLDGGGTTTIASGVTIRGHSGTIGQQINIGGTQTLVNNGTINADVAGGTIAFADSALVNNGLVRAQAGTVNVGVALSGSGALQVDSTGAMNLAAGAKTQGQLVMGAAGAAINLNTGNLTLSNDYTNAGAGSGNAFNRRAGVSGAGQIVASGDVAQQISGAGVSGGNTANATLTIGNVRVGTTNFDYAIGTSGTTGPTLRGAVQTSVNGANLTDARLSGSGVTASNYNAGAPAGSGETRTVSFTAANAGALAPLSGQVLNLRSNFENIADQKLNIVLGAGAAAYNAAAGAASPSPIVIANQRIGGNASQAITVTNTAAPGAFSEDLRATVGAISGAAQTNGASVNSLLAGGSNSGIVASVNTTTAGAKSGSIRLDYETLGTVGGTSNGLGTAGAGSQTINVSGNVYQLAAGAIQTTALNFGTVQVGQVVSQNLVVRNTASGPNGFVEDLNASFGATSGTGAGLISGSGSLNGILAGTNSSAANGTMTVNVNTTAAGTINGAIAVNYTSAGAVNGVANGLGALAVGSENYGVAGTIQTTGNVINQASPLVNNPTINLGAVRVGAASPTANVSVTNVATVAPQAALNASIGPTSGPISAGGSFNLLDPGATDSTSLQVGLDTAVAGNYTGSNAGVATIAFVSDASNVGNCAPNCQLTLASQNVSVAGKVYQQAAGTASGASINFGIVRVGDTVSARNIVVNNTAAVAGLNDTLRADLTGVGGAFGTSGSVSGIAAQASGNIAVSLSTANSGVFTANGNLVYLSQNGDMTDVSAGADQTVAISATVNNLADGVFRKVGGAGSLSRVGDTFFLDYGTLNLGDAISSDLDLANLVLGPADDLSGGFDTSGASGLTLAGFNPFANLLAGSAAGLLEIDFTAGMGGAFSRTIAFNGFSVNADDPLGIAQQRLLVIRGFVSEGGNNVPEPGSWGLVLLGGLAASVARRRAAARGGR